MATTTRRFKMRRDTAANWTAQNPVLAQGEPAREIDTGKEKRGDGTLAWNSLPYFAGGLLAGKDTINNTDVAPASLNTDRLGQTRAVTLSDGSTSTPAVLPALSGAIVDQGMMMFNPAGLGVVYPLATWKTAVGLSAQGLIDAISTILGTGWQGGGSAATAPAIFGTGDWSLTDPATDNDLTLTIITLPSNGGSAITALQYELNGSGTWVALTGTGTGARTISGLTNGVSYSVKVRAVNAVGPTAPTGPTNGASAAKTATPSASGGYTPNFVSTNGGVSTFSVPANQFSAGGADSNKLTFALTANRADDSGTKYYFDFPGRSVFKQVGANFHVDIYSITNSQLYEARIQLPTGAHTLALSIDLSVPSVEWRIDGVLQSVTGNPATGVEQLVAPVIGVIDWSNGSGAVPFFNAGPVAYVGTIADMYFETGFARATSLFFSGSNPSDWSSIGAPQIWPGDGRSAAQWNAGTHGGTSTITASGWT